MEAMVSQEAATRKAIKEETSGHQWLANDAAAIRARNRSLEQELLPAQNIEESSKSRADAALAQAQEESIRFDKASHEHQSRLKVFAAEKAKVEEELSQIETKIQGINHQVAETKQRASQLGIEDGTDVNTEMLRVQDLLKESKAAAQGPADRNASLQAGIERSKEGITKCTDSSTEYSKAAQELTGTAETDMIAEETRSSDYEAIRKDLKRQEDEETRLKAAVKDLEETRSREEKEYEQTLEDHEHAIKENSDSIKKAKADIEASHDQFDLRTSEWEAEKRELGRKLDAAKSGAADPDDAVKFFDRKSTERNRRDEENFQKRLNELKEKARQEEDDEMAIIRDRQKSKLICGCSTCPLSVPHLIFHRTSKAWIYRSLAQRRDIVKTPHRKLSTSSRARV